MTQAAIPVQVHLFARYAELLGHERVDLQLAPGTTVGGLVSRLRAMPGGDRLPARLLVARNLEQVGDEATVSAGDEIALLPPMSGG